MEFVKGLRPVSYKFNSEGNVVEEVDDVFEEIQQQITEKLL